MPIKKTTRRKLKKVDPKPAAKVDDAADVLLAQKPPPPFRSVAPPRSKKPSNVGILIGFVLIIAGLGALVFLNYWPK